jgi:retinol dehydrogenase-12
MSSKILSNEDFDVAGKTCLVTGATDGIGFAAAEALAANGAKVVIAARNEEKGKAALAQIKELHPNAELEFEKVDFSSQDSIRQFAARYIASKRPLHVLLNNAGGWNIQRRESIDGIELSFATNHLGYFLTTQLLAPVLLKSAPARVVNVASGLARDLDFEDVNFKRRRYTGVRGYAQSKQANRMWSWALSRRLQDKGVTVNVMNPGDTRTGAFKKGGGVLGWVVHFGNIALGAKSAAAGADTAVWLAASKSVAGVTGRYFEKREEVVCQFRDTAREETLWALCERLTTPLPLMTPAQPELRVARGA